MYLENLLKIPNGLRMLNQAIDLTKIDINSFFVAAKDDHIAPWTSVYDSANLLSGNKTFCLTSSGHVSGIVNPPCGAQSKYNYKIYNDLSSSNLESILKSEEKQGSWWPAWNDWLTARSETLDEPLNYDNLDYIELSPGAYSKIRIRDDNYNN
jgi:polyhydroxyalkanoate synthase